jgi:ribosomal protein S18 acetylase RimI-like enzyme
MTTLTPMHPDAFASYRDAMALAYAEENIASGRWPAQGALQRSYEDFDQSLPSGLSTPDHHVYEIRDERTGNTVGVLWFAVVVKHGLKSAFVYDVEIQPAFRRQGHARAAFAELEPLVRDLGLSSIGLHVFGHNPGAQALYDSLGYGVTGINMLKHLGNAASTTASTNALEP